MAAVREVDEGHVHVESFVLSVDAEDQQLLAPLGQGFSAALAGARPTAAAVAPATAARRDTTMGMRNALAAARTARRTDRKNMLCKVGDWTTSPSFLKGAPTPSEPGRLPCGENGEDRRADSPLGKRSYGTRYSIVNTFFVCANGSLCFVVSS